MAYNQYTKCVDPSNYNSMTWYVQAIIKTGILGTASAILFAVLGGWCALLAIPISAAVAILSYCSWWLNDRLICLGGPGGRDVFAIGAVLKCEPPYKKAGLDAYDSDFSVTLLLVNCAVGCSQQVAESSDPYGWLVKETGLDGLGLVFHGQTAGDANSHGLHCEFEGAGVRDTADGAGVGLVLALAAAFACLAIPPPWGPIVAAILTILALFAMLLGSYFGKHDYGNPTDVNPALPAPSLHQLDGAPAGAKIDILAVKGTWVMDAGHQWDSTHNGWNEIHPIKVCYKAADPWDPTTKWPDLSAQVARGSSALSVAASPATKKAQQDPTNIWSVHPLIDGCRSRPQIPELR